MRPPSGTLPSRGEVWTADFGAPRGHEQGGTRPALVVSVDPFNHGPAALIVVAPITSRRKGVVTHVPVDPPEGGVSVPSYVKCEDIRSIARDRLFRRTGRVSAATLMQIEDRLRMLLGL